MKVNNKKPIIALVGVLVFALVGLTFAYFQSSASFENVFNTGTYKVVTTEVFESPDNWKPGEEIPKTITTKNEGTIDAAVRVSYTEQWLDENNQDITSQITAGTAIINLDNTGDWTKEGNYYYYNYILKPTESTSSFMKSVTLNPDLNGVVCTTSQDGLTKTCTSSNPALGAKYKLTLTKETVQYDKYKEAWNTQVNIIEKPSALAIGDSVNYSTTLNGQTLNNWKVFLSDENYTYLIYGDYLPNAAISEDLQSTYIMTTEQDYGVLDFGGEIGDFEAAMSTKSNWSDLINNGLLNESALSSTIKSDVNVWAMGAPTVELWVNSWNAKYPSDKLYTRYIDTEDIDNSNFYATGYAIGNESNPTTKYIDLSDKSGYNNTLYFPRKIDDAPGAEGYWLSSPSADGENVLITVTYDGYLYYEPVSCDGGHIFAFRPVIKLPTSVVATGVANQ